MVFHFGSWACNFSSIHCGPCQSCLLGFHLLAEEAYHEVMRKHSLHLQIGRTFHFVKIGGLNAPLSALKRHYFWEAQEEEVLAGLHVTLVYGIGGNRPHYVNRRWQSYGRTHNATLDPVLPNGE